MGDVGGSATPDAGVSGRAGGTSDTPSGCLPDDTPAALAGTAGSAGNEVQVGGAGAGGHHGRAPDGGEGGEGNHGGAPRGDAGGAINAGGLAGLAALHRGQAGASGSDAGTCPEDMSAVGPFCIDRYEASRPDATESDPGKDGTRATSRPGVLPWMVHPMTDAALAEFDEACGGAGKRLCTTEEWSVACSGPAQTPYVYGASFDREACNCVDTYCDDYCSMQGIETAICDTAVNCGYTYSCYHEDPTGAHDRCTNGYGTFDMNGNGWEVVPSQNDARGYELRGGAFNCASAPTRVNCTFNASWTDLFAGFRCCKDRT